MSDCLDAYKSELTKREHAAISMRVPDSGNPELDAMIRRARRWDMATAMMQSLVFTRDENWVRMFRNYREYQEAMGRVAARYADSLLAALDQTTKEGGEG